MATTPNNPHEIVSPPPAGEGPTWVEDYKAGLKPGRDTQHERSFRRGYMHGYDKALTDMAHFLSRMYRQDAADFLAEFYDEALTPWRIRCDEGFEPPPDARHYQKRSPQDG